MMMLELESFVGIDAPPFCSILYRGSGSVERDTGGSPRVSKGVWGSTIRPPSRSGFRPSLHIDPLPGVYPCESVVSNSWLSARANASKFIQNRWSCSTLTLIQTKIRFGCSTLPSFQYARVRFFVVKTEATNQNMQICSEFRCVCPAPVIV